MPGTCSRCPRSLSPIVCGWMCGPCGSFFVRKRPSDTGKRNRRCSVILQGEHRGSRGPDQPDRGQNEDTGQVGTGGGDQETDDCRRHCRTEVGQPVVDADPRGHDGAGHDALHDGVADRRADSPHDHPHHHEQSAYDGPGHQRRNPDRDGGSVSILPSVRSILRMDPPRRYPIIEPSFRSKGIISLQD